MLPPSLNPIKNIEVPLCKGCHRKVHSYYGKHNSPKYLNEVKRLTDQLSYAQKRVKELENHSLEG
jgi:hypothetical protein